MRKHHVVSAGYLRHWGKERRPGKKLIRLLTKDGSIDAIVPVEKALWVRGFNSAFVAGQEDDRLEDEFADIERATLPIIGRIVAGRMEGSVAYACEGASSSTSREKFSIP